MLDAATSRRYTCERPFPQVSAGKSDTKKTEATRKRVRGKVEREENKVVVDLTEPQERSKVQEKSAHDGPLAKSWAKAKSADIDAAVANFIYSESVAARISTP